MTDERMSGVSHTGGSDARSPRELEPTLRSHDIDDLLDQLEEQEDGGTGRRTITLLHRPALRVVLTRLEGGASVADEASDQDVAIVALSGEGTVTATDTSEDLDADRLVTVAAGIDWSLSATDELVALLVFGGRIDRTEVAS